MLDQCHQSDRLLSLKFDSTLRHFDTSTPPDTPTLRHCSTPVKEVICQESPPMADTAPTPLRHCPDTARHPDTSVNRHCPDTAPTLPRTLTLTLALTLTLPLTL